MITVSGQVPPFATKRDPLDVAIRIRPDSSGWYAADILPSGQGAAQRFPIELSKDDVRELNEQLRDVMQYTVSKYSKLSTRKLMPDQQDSLSNLEHTEEQALWSLAEIGHITFNRVWNHPDAMTTMKELIAIGRPLRFEISSEDFFLPWELLYPASLDEPISMNWFWGMSHIISRIIVRSQRPGAYVDPEILLQSGPTLGLFTYNGLQAVVAKEIPFFEKLTNEQKIYLRHLRSLDADPLKKREELREIQLFCHHPFDLLHFACHAFYEHNRPGLSHLILSDKFSLRIQDIEAYKIRVEGNPLVIINACGTGNLNPLYTSYFAAAFLKLGARGVVSTECEVPDDFAADFIEHLYELLLQGVPIGTSLLQTRRHFAEQYNNPSGLLYSLYGSPFIQMRF